MHCLQCNSSPIKWVERDAPEKGFCSQLCHIEYFYVGLLGYEEDVVGLESNDGQQVQISVSDARKMETVKNLIEDAGTKEYIPLPNINGATLLVVKRHLEQGFIDTRNLSDEAFLNLLAAANYLDYPDLTYGLISEWINDRPFPGRVELKGLCSDAFYFFRGDIASDPRFSPDTQNLRNVHQQFRTMFRVPGVKGSVYFATQKNLFWVVKYLLQTNSDFDFDLLNTAFRDAARFGYLDIMKLLIKRADVNPGADDNYAIRAAATRGHTEVVNFLLDVGDARIDPSAENDTPFYSAAQSDFSLIAQRLLKDSRVLASERNIEKAMNVCAVNDSIMVMRLIVRYRRFFSKEYLNRFLLPTACSLGSIKIVGFLLTLDDIDPAYADKKALREAVDMGRVEIVELLLQDGRIDSQGVDSRSFEVNEVLQKYSQQKRARTRKQIF